MSSSNISYTREASKALYPDVVQLNPTGSGSLNGLKCAIKGNTDLQGFKTYFGSKAWYAIQEVAKQHADCVKHLLAAGATINGRAVDDELNLSLFGINRHYGTPVNPAAPNCVPGGSSSGSASAVACGLVSFALGTDCAGSTRVPASNCGTLGMRPTVGRINDKGVVDFSAKTSTISVFAKNLSILEAVMHVLLSNKSSAQVSAPPTVLMLEEAYQLADKEVQSAVEKELAKQGIKVGKISLREIVGENDADLKFWNEKVLGIIQGYEIWSNLRPFADKKPDIDPPVQGLLGSFATITPEMVEEAKSKREEMAKKVMTFFNAHPGTIFCFPTTPIAAPKISDLQDGAKIGEYYQKTMAVTSFAGTANLPEISVPGANVRGVPVGISFVAASGKDELLLSSLKTLCPHLAHNSKE